MVVVVCLLCLPTSDRGADRLLSDAYGCSFDLRRPPNAATRCTRRALKLGQWNGMKPSVGALSVSPQVSPPPPLPLDCFIRRLGVNYWTGGWAAAGRWRGANGQATSVRMAGPSELRRKWLADGRSEWLVFGRLRSLSASRRRRRRRSNRLLRRKWAAAARRARVASGQRPATSGRSKTPSALTVPADHLLLLGPTR